MRLGKVLLVSFVAAAAFACRTTGGSSNVKDDSSGASGATGGSASCQQQICPFVAFQNGTTCTATGSDGSTFTATASNNCLANNGLVTQICAQNQDPSTFQINCGTTTSPPTDQCAGAQTCPFFAAPGGVDCQATDQSGNVVGTAHGANGCLAGNSLNQQVCSAGLDPTTTTVSCTPGQADGGATSASHAAACQSFHPCPFICFASGETCTATDKQTHSSAGSSSSCNSCLATNDLTSELCSQGKDPAKFSISCKMNSATGGLPPGALGIPAQPHSAPPGALGIPANN